MAFIGDPFDYTLLPPFSGWKTQTLPQLFQHPKVPTELLDMIFGEIRVQDFINFLCSCRSVVVNVILACLHSQKVAFRKTCYDNQYQIIL
jgi:hypothetical protein